MDEYVLLIKESLDKSDPHGYCSSAEKSDADFRSPSKRSFLSECIRQIYILNGRMQSLPLVPSPIEFNKSEIVSTINGLLRPPWVSTRRASLQHVKRQLFRESKARSRKTRPPQRNPHPRSDVYHFKAARPVVGVRKIRRSYMNVARKDQIHARPSQRASRKRKCSDRDLEQIAVSIEAREGSFHVSQNTISKVCKYHQNMVRPHPHRDRSLAEQEKRDRNTEACRLSRRAKKLEELLVQEQYEERIDMNEKILEESIRSIYYMKALLSLMVDHEENLYI